MKTLQKFGFSALSPELFGSFFSLDISMTERIINTLLNTEFRIDRLEEEIPENGRFQFLNSCVIADAHTEAGRLALAITLINEDTEDATSDILNWILSRVMLKRRNVYPLLLVFDTTVSGGEKGGVEMRVIDNHPFPFALAVVWAGTSSGRKKCDTMLEDLMRVIPEEIEDDKIRRLYYRAFRKSGLEEKEIVSYSIWLESVKRDIVMLGDIPGI